ncbi:uncharacterized protein FFB20_00892 [Fusarium fujikuroi]|uniref:Uncharacterized protein n=1 Tax=Gibberella fujikuroi (strain CBS 195.34 / IMI 58289 / NRRL A-6831) TaxID=1279085 RepID=S0EQ10_GIBF5|nr:uncharacterized protein FFUJ_11825 [Fusarium fujikuroi IMI 58289]KLP09760.1 uncharacterized protein Y057_5278 [Fusarium fujikuroi]CCT76085.1 uncharacterized protein FFUJ_11825 [Fusarium fujikuroi IMI 58289]SCN64675.1 uncharacterized protein FFB20_00892 [Fusarium fujikuroi]SCN70453.1 uncharacterized protein FFE2_02003 [Fusarium fujikuroi]SCO14384.1 uncharacterized protein FFM5_10829 [Fusarium fujikuroi]
MPGRDPGISYGSSPDTKKMPGVLCPKCTTTEKQVWVMPGHPLLSLLRQRDSYV